MNFTELVEAVIAKVKRPDKLELARTEINAALVYYCTEFDYSYDLVELNVPFVPAESAITLPMTTFTRFRKMDYVKVGGSRTYICELKSRLLSSNCDLRNKWYNAGNSFRINTAEPVASLDFSYFAYPPTLTDDAPDHWMLNGNWPAIKERATSVVFEDIGDAEASALASRRALDLALAFRNDYVRANQHS